jgi:hypothetical protein
MADDKEFYGVTQQTSAVDDGLNKSGNIKEANVASVALGMFGTFSFSLASMTFSKHSRDAKILQPPPWRHRSRSYSRRT